MGTNEEMKEIGRAWIEELLAPIDREEFWARINAMGKSVNRSGPQAQAKRDGRDAVLRILAERAEKMLGEHPDQKEKVEP